MSKNVPKFRFKGFEDEWKEKSLGSLLEFKNGINADKEAYGKGVKFINVLDILNNNFITYDNIIGYVDIDDDTLEKYSVNYGDIVFQRSSETREEVGTANVYLDEKQATFGGFVIRGKKVGEYNPMFMNGLLKSSAARKEIVTKAGGSTRYNVGQDILSSVNVKLPSLQEQEKIANFLSKVDSIIEKQEKKVEYWNSYKKGMMQKIFSQKIRFKDENGLDYPEWEYKKVTEVAHTFIGLVTTMTENYVENGVKLIRNSDIKENKIIMKNLINLDEDFAKKNSSRFFKLNDVVTVHTGDIGTSAVINQKLVDSLGFATINTRPNHEKLNSYYLAHYFNSYENKKYAIRMSTGDGRSNYNLKDFDKSIIKLPCLKEQIKIAEFLSNIDDIIEKEAKKLEELREWKKGLLQQMFV